MRHSITFFAALLLAAPAVSRGVPALLQDGVYQALDYSDETAGLEGMAIQVMMGERPTVIVATCDGQCQGGGAWPPHANADSLWFAICNPANATDPSPKDCPHPTRYIGHVQRDGSLRIGRMPSDGDGQLILRRVAKPGPEEVQSLVCEMTCQ